MRNYVEIMLHSVGITSILIYLCQHNSENLDDT